MYELVRFPVVTGATGCIWHFRNKVEYVVWDDQLRTENKFRTAALRCHESCNHQVILAPSLFSFFSVVIWNLLLIHSLSDLPDFQVSYNFYFMLNSVKFYEWFLQHSTSSLIPPNVVRAYGGEKTPPGQISLFNTSVLKTSSLQGRLMKIYKVLTLSR